MKPAKRRQLATTTSRGRPPDRINETELQQLAEKLLKKGEMKQVTLCNCDKPGRGCKCARDQKGRYNVKGWSYCAAAKFDCLAPSLELEEEEDDDNQADDNQAVPDRQEGRQVIPDHGKS